MTRKLAILAALLSMSASAHAFEPMDVRPFSTVSSMDEPLAIPAPSLLPRGAGIAVARVDLGRLIPVPYAEAKRWGDVSARTGDRLVPMSAGAYLDAVPVIDFEAHDTDNKLDEMRLAAVDEGFDWLLVYGFGEDADAGFARRAPHRTGWSGDLGGLDASAHSKAVLVDTRTGEVLAVVTDGKQDRWITGLSDRVGAAVEAL